MAGIRQLRQIQLGQESTAGTAVAATTRWRGLGALSDNREIVMPEEFIGIIGGGDRSYIPKLEGAATFDSTDATFEQLSHLLNAGVAKDVAGTADGVGSGYIYTHAIPYNAAPDIQTYTIRAGDNQQAEIMEYCFVTSLSLSANAGEALMMGAEWMGRQVQDSTFTGSVAVPSVETILASKATMYIDDTDGAYGTTAVSSTLLGMTLDLSNTVMPKYTMDGQLYFGFHYAGNREITGSLRFEHNSSATTERGNFRTQTPRLLRLEFEGSALTTEGTAYANKTLIIDLPIKYTSFDPLGDQDGNSIITANFTSKYNETVGDAGKFIVVNELSAMP